MSRTPQQPAVAAPAHSETALRRAMDAALAAALRGPRGANPLVGASILAADGRLVTGHHAGAGTPHAEVAALTAARSAGMDLSSATACVTLEPCSHHGRTGPCAQALIDAGVPEVVIARTDPNPAAAGGIAVLEAAGTRVRTGVESTRAGALNARWLRAVEQRRPYVTLKLAQSLDGRIAAADGTSQWLTSATSRARVHRLRAVADAVMVGTGTALADDPRLTARAPETLRSPEAAQPVPVVMGMRELPSDAHLARDPRAVRLRTRDPLAGLRELRRRGLEHVLVEGGAGLAGALVREDLVDSLEVHIAPVLLGEGLPALTGLGIGTLSAAPRWVPDPAADWDSHRPGRTDTDTDTILRLIPAAASARGQEPSPTAQADLAAPPTQHHTRRD
ncbi:bifunctional diaminohydroxyphosphoribosylaminopyrimidine deaminase/5-amino-6-(5-phosphoribosylamino)uracil reductase RibD [Brevibacterium album]|uniref:bifunctional diaminohydroxyphosphoribosylaminopyrimidine deaminase/5-amino-6-(5-phosphoribosylamino)uracil reductase RibD n=1 Tax=Brevibacterium album TaxID=417948 RepID=UPI0003FC5885|nr:bifunctional diaminohydroxyphosphoribosylaminopyrimidine deaminase/5-amino-6-(5-phosphoribosylamino)uracil reductase RibD [Brevibacterium album]